MQVRAIIEAAVQCHDDGIDVRPEIMIPLSIDPWELRILVDRTRDLADAILAERGAKLDYLVGTMVETPRAALLAHGMGDVAEFFSFGTNDLTQLTMGLSRDDAGRFLPDYLSAPKAAGGSLEGSSMKPIFSHDPFQSLDADGVGKLMTMACDGGRKSRPAIKLGICGEHGGDPDSIRFCESLGLDYVSCSPFRVPVARLCAAQAAIEQGSKPRDQKSRPGGNRTTARDGRSRPAAHSKRSKRAKTSRRTLKNFRPKDSVRAGTSRRLKTKSRASGSTRAKASGRMKLSARDTTKKRSGKKSRSVPARNIQTVRPSLGKEFVIRPPARRKRRPALVGA